jgi:hypothetical protein
MATESLVLAGRTCPALTSGAAVCRRVIHPHHQEWYMYYAEVGATLVNPVFKREAITKTKNKIPFYTTLHGSIRTHLF